MLKKGLILVAVMIMTAATTASAGIFDIAVLPAGDGSSWRYWSYWGNGSGFDTGANPNMVRHSYWPGDGNESNSYLQFKLSDFTGTASEVTSASLNLNLLGFVSGGQQTRDLKGTIGHASNPSTANGNASQKISGNESVGSILGSTPLGWNAFDVTQYIKNDLTGDFDWSVFSLNSSGYAGFTFSSAEGQDPAFLRIITDDASGGDDDPNAVPEPATMALFGLGSVGLAFLRRKKA